MADLQRVAARLLRLALWTGAGLVAVAGGADGLGASTVARVVGAVGIGVVVAAPFATLVAIAIAGRRSRTTAYALVSLALAVAGVLLAG